MKFPHKVKLNTENVIRAIALYVGDELDINPMNYRMEINIDVNSDNDQTFSVDVLVSEPEVEEDEE